MSMKTSYTLEEIAQAFEALKGVEILAPEAVALMFEIVSKQLILNELKPMYDSLPLLEEA